MHIILPKRDFALHVEIGNGKQNKAKQQWSQQERKQKKQCKDPSVRKKERRIPFSVLAVTRVTA